MMKKVTASLLTLAAIGVSSSLCSAATLIISDGFTTTGALVAPASGILTYSNPAFDAAWGITVTFAETKPAVGSVTSPILDISLQAVGHGLSPARSLMLMWSDNNFGPVNGFMNAQLTGHTVALNGQTINFNTYYDSGNTLQAQTTPLTASGPLSDPYSSSKNASLNQALFSLTQVLVIGGTPAGGADATYSVEGSLSLVPEPSSALLVLLGLGGLVFGRNFRRN
jgi:hypothetical protein